MEDVVAMDVYAMEQAGIFSMEELRAWGEQNAEQDEQRRQALLNVKAIAESRSPIII